MAQLEVRNIAKTFCLGTGAKAKTVKALDDVSFDIARVGIARALATEPDILLMDEPFGALDAQTREDLQNELMDIHAETQKTILIITHDMDEAVLLADRVIVMKAGRVDTILTIDIPRPRGKLAGLRGNAEFGRKRLALWECLQDAAPVSTMEA
jgi:NitT/TauT family transport system ATP-binding protein